MKNPSKLFLTRHGQTEWNVANRLQGQLDSPLTPSGRAQAVELKMKLSEKDIDVVYSSPLPRAMETAKIITAKKAIKIIKRDNLAAMKLGPWQGKTYKEIKKLYPDEFVDFFKYPADFSLAGAENYQEFQKRVVSEIGAIFRENVGQNILVVTHAIVIKVILAYIKNEGVTGVSKMPVLKNATYITIEQIYNRA